MITDTELHNKISLFITKLDKMESRVREVEAVATKIPEMEAALSKISSRVDTFESKSPAMESSKEEKSAGAPLSRGRAVIYGVVVGLIIVGILAAVWMLKLF